MSSQLSNVLSDIWDEEVKWYQAEFEVEEPWDIPTDQLEECSYKGLRRVQDLRRIQETLIDNLQAEVADLTHASVNHKHEVIANATLRKACEKLKKDNKELKEELADMVEQDHQSYSVRRDEELKEHGVDNMEEIDELREHIEEIENQDPTKEEARLLETMRKGFMAEIMELKEEIEGWKTARCDDIREAKGEVQEELDELKEEKRLMEHGIASLNRVAALNKAEIEKLTTEKLMSEKRFENTFESLCEAQDILADQSLYECGKCKKWADGEYKEDTGEYRGYDCVEDEDEDEGLCAECGLIHVAETEGRCPSYVAGDHE